MSSRLRGHDDPVELFRRSNPVDPIGQPGTDAPRADALAQEIVKLPVDTLHRGPRGARRQWTIVLLAASAAVAVAAAVMLTRDVSAVGSIGCFREPSLEGDAAIVRSDGRDPITLCRELWETDAFPRAPSPPEELVECVLPTGVLGVFPAAHCSQVQNGDDPDPDISVLPPPDGQHVIDASEFARHRDRLVEMFLEEDCPTMEHGEGLVQEAFEEGLFPGWSVVLPEQGHPERPCATLGFDESTRTILLVPSEPPQ